MTMSHYNELVLLDKLYRDRGLEILAFPCNQFGGQEPGSAKDIRAFCDKMGVQFRVMEKVNVNPPDEHAVYSFLKQGGQRVRWNFYSKFLVSCGEERCTIDRYDGVMPKALKSEIESALPARA
eukprot:TRINITY_DN46130_c0_g1_i1.p1 TRINITY_DN46130_c0_g1~~TRINITY_DN46130_c0_g1_i1.p1  ORF type:complete len:123 (+),score=16.16 TRINITY_DN46130_c0_g1_i1:323-691(+)